VIAAAIRYAERGFPVFPCRETSDKAQGSKAPYLSGETKPGAKDGGHWLATTSVDEIETWWRRWPHALIGFPTGERSATVVVDLDPKDHKLADMYRALCDWCGGDMRGVEPSDGELILPGAALTQSGGLHLYYLYPSTKNLQALGLPQVGNRGDMFKHFVAHGEAAPVLAHIDVRGEGGYVIAPPSVMSNGAKYRWLVPPKGAGGGRFRLPYMPDALVEIVCGLRIPKAAQAEQEKRAEKAARFSGNAITDQRVRAYVKSMVDGALNFSAIAGEGNRNAAVYWAATRLAQFVKSGHLSRAEAEALLYAHLPAGVSPGERKIQGTIKSGLNSTQVVAFDPAQLDEGRP